MRAPSYPRSMWPSGASLVICRHGAQTRNIHSITLALTRVLVEMVAIKASLPQPAETRVVRRNWPDRFLHAGLSTRETSGLRPSTRGFLLPPWMTIKHTPKRKRRRAIFIPSSTSTLPTPTYLASLVLDQRLWSSLMWVYLWSGGSCTSDR